MNINQILKNKIYSIILWCQQQVLLLNLNLFSVLFYAKNEHNTNQAFKGK